MTEPRLAVCPLCRRELVGAYWIDEYRQFLVDCPLCTTFTITPGLVSRFQCLLIPSERRMVQRLSHYLQRAEDDDDREVTERSWLRLAAEE